MMRQNDAHLSLLRWIRVNRLRAKIPLPGRVQLLLAPQLLNSQRLAAPAAHDHLHLLVIRGESSEQSLGVPLLVIRGAPSEQSLGVPLLVIRGESSEQSLGVPLLVIRAASSEQSLGVPLLVIRPLHHVPMQWRVAQLDYSSRNSMRLDGRDRLP